MSQKWMCVNMGMFVNPDNLAFQAALNARIYVDKSGILNYTNSVLGSTDAFICIVVQEDLENLLLQICLQRITAKDAIQKKCFPDWKSVRQKILENI